MRKELIVIVLASFAGMAYAADKPAMDKAPMATKPAAAPAQAAKPSPVADSGKATTPAKPMPTQSAKVEGSAGVNMPMPPEAAEPVAKPKAKARKRLPRGDLSHCLELKDNAAIIKCSESHRKK